jgi:hypothetical protein
MDFALQLVTVFLGSGAAIAVAKILFEHRREALQRRDSTEYLALQLAFQLESYAIECARKISDHRLAKEYQGDVGQIIARVPMLAPFPQSEAYRQIDRALLDDVMDFPQRCEMSNQAALFWWEVVGDPDCCNVAMEENTIQMGTRALDIARRLRTHYKLPARNLTFGKWNLDKFFSEELTKLQAVEIRRQEADKASASTA